MIVTTQIKRKSKVKMFACSECGYKSIKWLGKCPYCSGWETFNEEKPVPKKGHLQKEKSAPALLKDIQEQDYKRIKSSIKGFDRILGGGLVPGEVVLVGGEPGVGKSTLLLEVAAKLSNQGKTLYVSAEESPQQIALRVKRLKQESDNLYILGEDNLETVYEHIKRQQFRFVIVDSIQVVHCADYEGSKGTISQIRGCADYLTQIAKSTGIVLFVVGHVTKDGAIAGPKLLEHIVDCVLYFEGETLSNYRILRATKNRFGPTGDISLFEMVSTGLKEVEDTSDIFIPHRQGPISGSSIVCVIEGVRPMLIELQSLVSRSSFGVARRRSLGFDFNRFSLLIAIIEKRLKIPLSGEDVFLNVAGGLKLTDPAADLGAVIAMISSHREKDVFMDIAFIGEVGLAGELRRVRNINLRLKEIERAKFKSCFIPETNKKDLDQGFSLNINPVKSLPEVIEAVFK
ncbi:MAG: DNA repair protein RadA [Candidatus Omnitrophica bacterium]|nr:DNA repair protein RadA [Candidatus Omnitrophota bacterium]